MPAQRKPLHVLETTGSFSTHPERRPKPHPKNPSALGNPPKHFLPAARQCWFELLKMFPTMLIHSDRWTVELACLMMVKHRVGTASPSETGKLMQCLEKFGGSPLDRQRVGIPEAVTNADNPFADFADTAIRAVG